MKILYGNVGFLQRNRLVSFNKNYVAYSIDLFIY